jgi:hypothetical protein
MAGATNAHVPIDAPQASPPRLGLLASAVRPTGVDPRWVNGIEFAPEACLDDDEVWWTCPEGEGGDAPGDKPSASNRPELVRYRPVELVAHDTCSALGYTIADYQARARRNLVATQSRKMEAELWSGTAAIAANFPNAYLADAASAVDLGLFPLVYGLAALQEYLAATIPGRGMIHATVRTVTLWLSAGVIRREGTVLLDVMDNIVVPGTGYDGSGPGGEPAPASGDRAWAYATGLVHVLEDEIVATPSTIGEALDRTTNVVTMRAERTVAAFWDGCAHAAAEIDLCSTCCDPSSS